MHSQVIERELTRNRAAVDALALVAAHIPATSWSSRSAPDRWTPAQQVSHVILAYKVTTLDVRDGLRARFIGKPRQRVLWRLLGLSQVMVLGRLPPGAPAPREIRPPDLSPDRPLLMDQLRTIVDDFEQTMRRASRDEPTHRLAHPYFGWLSLRQAVRVCAVHTRHHSALLALTP